MVYKPGKVWWFEFIFNGQRIRESAKTSSKRVAEEAEKARRRDLEPRRQSYPKACSRTLLRRCGGLAGQQNEPQSLQ
jgi:hypothetical protein